MCFSLQWLGQVLVWFVILGAAVALIRLLLPLALGWLGVAGGVLQRAIEIVLWAAVCIAIIWLVIGLLECLIGGGGLRLFPHR